MDQVDQWDKANSIEEINKFWETLPKVKITDPIVALIANDRIFHAGIKGSQVEVDILVSAKKLKERNIKYEIVELISRE